jgi:hypothetical protein
VVYLTLTKKDETPLEVTFADEAAHPSGAPIRVPVMEGTDER